MANQYNKNKGNNNKITKYISKKEFEENKLIGLYTKQDIANLIYKDMIFRGYKIESEYEFMDNLSFKTKHRYNTDKWDSKLHIVSEFIGVEVIFERKER